MDPTTRFLLSLLTPEPHAPEGVDWVRAERWLAIHSLTPLAVAHHRAAERAGGALLPQALAERGDPAHRATAVRTAQLSDLADDVLARFSESGIPALRFKGIALLGLEGYPDRGARPMDDIDLLVRPEDAAGAVQVLLEAGCTPWTPWEEDHPLLEDSFSLNAPGSSEGAPLTVDLHWRTEYGRPRFGRGVPEGSGESPLWVGADLKAGLPAHGPHLVVLAENALSHFGHRTHVLGLADIGRLVGRVSSWDRVVRVGSGRELAAGVGLLLGEMEEELGLPVPRGAIRALGGEGIWVRSARGRIRPSRLLGRPRAVRTRAGALLLRAALLGSPLRALHAARHTLLPPASWLRARYRDPHAARWRLRLRYLGEVGRWLAGAGGSPVSSNPPPPTR